MASDSDSAKTFHRFPYLPLELREMIWKRVIRSWVPGAHFFGTFKPPKSVPTGHAIAVNERAEASTPVLAAPLHNNPSTYMIDRGLWNACRESRSIIRQDFAERSKTSHHGRAELRKLDKGQGIRGHFVGDGEDHYFTCGKATSSRRMGTSRKTLFCRTREWGSAVV